MSKAERRQRRRKAGGHLHRARVWHRHPRIDLVQAAREAGDAGFDVLIACAFNYEAHTTEFNKLGRIPVLKARMNADLHMADDLKNTGKGNLFVIFGEPDIEHLARARGHQVRVKINGVDVFPPNTGEVAATGPRASPAGSSTPTTTRRASSSATPTSWAPTTPTSRAQDHPQGGDQRRRLGDASTATHPAPSTNRSRNASPSR
jgi:hypothetical protein